MNLDETGRAINLTLHDVIRWLIRGGMPNTEANQQEALLAVDAHEQGFPDSASWKEELAARAKAASEAAPAPPGETADEKIARLEALLVRAEAATRAAALPAAERPEKPKAPA